MQIRLALFALAREKMVSRQNSHDSAMISPFSAHRGGALKKRRSNKSFITLG
jgi:hypothetical protein